MTPEAARKGYELAREINRLDGIISDLGDAVDFATSVADAVQQASPKMMIAEAARFATFSIIESMRSEAISMFQEKRDQLADELADL